MSGYRSLSIAAIFFCISPLAAQESPVEAPRLGHAATILPGQRQYIEIHTGGPETLATALAGLAQWRIAPGASVILRIADGTYRQTGTLRIEHPDGVRIQIVGNTVEPGKVRLTWPPQTDGIYVGTGQVLGRLDGVMLSRDIPGGNDNGASDNACGLLAENAGVLLAGPAVVVDGFYYGAQARYGGVMRLHGITVRHAGDAGFFAFNGGHIEAQSAKAEHASDTRLGLGSGFVAEYGGSIDASGAQASNNLLAGFTALSGGSIVANDATAIANYQFGFYAITNGSIVAHRAIEKKSGVKASYSSYGGNITGLEER